MNKEEILAKSRKENNDEGKKNAENKGREIGIVSFLIVLVFLLIFNMCNGQSNDALAAVFWSYVAAESYPRYRFSKDKTLLVTAIAGSFLSIANLITYVMRVVG